MTKPYDLRIEPDAHKQRKKLPGNVRQRIKRAISDLAEDPRPVRLSVEKVQLTPAESFKTPRFPASLIPELRITTLNPGLAHRENESRRLWCLAEGGPAIVTARKVLKMGCL